MDNVKEKIEDELFYMLHEKTLDKITVTELCKKCKLSRQSFYYYFKDLHGVLEAIFKRQAENIMGTRRNVKSWKSGYVDLLRWSLEHEDYVMNVMNSVKREEIEHCVNRKIYGYAYGEVSRFAEKTDLPECQKEYISEFYSLSLTAHYIRWLEKGMKSTPESEGAKLGVLLDGNIFTAIQKFKQLNANNSAG